MTTLLITVDPQTRDERISRVFQSFMRGRSPILKSEEGYIHTGSRLVKWCILCYALQQYDICRRWLGSPDEGGPGGVRLFFVHSSLGASAGQIGPCVPIVRVIVSEVTSYTGPKISGDRTLPTLCDP